MIIRAAQDGDLEGMRILYTHLNPADPVLAGEKVRGAWREMLGNPGVHCLVAEMEGKLVATCTLVVVPNLTRGARPYGLVENVVTLAEHRRKGIGTAMLKAALEQAWGMGCYKVMLMTGSKKEETLRFYEGAGFKSGEKTGLVARLG